MKAVTETKNKLTFSGHDSFQCRQFWLKKGYDYLKSDNSFNNENAVVKLGVGKNMVSAIRFWLKAFNIVDIKDKPTWFGTKLLDDNGWDPFLEDEASLWLLHYHLVKNNFASTYNLIFNELRRENTHFDKNTYLNFLKRKNESGEEFDYNIKTVEADFDVFVKMYQMTEPTNKDIEDSFSGILSEINLLRVVENGRNTKYQIENSERTSLPEEVLLYSILDNNTYGDSIGLNSLESNYNSPVAIFALNRTGLLEKIKEITKFDNRIIYTDQSGIRELQFKTKIEPSEVLEKYYDK